MGFLPNYNTAPSENVPRKHGVARLWELSTRDFWDNFRAGFLAILGCAPLIAGVWFAVDSHVLIFAPVIGLLGGMIAGPELCGLADTILRGLRDEPGFWWHTYQRAWRRNAREALLPGAITGALLATQVFLLLHAGAMRVSVGMGAALIAGILVVLGVNLYIWPQMALLELPFAALLKNAGILFLGQLPRSLAALAIVAVYWGLIVRFFVLAVTILPLTNFWLPALPALFLIYPGIESNFQIEQKLYGAEYGAEEVEKIN